MSNNVQNRNIDKIQRLVLKFTDWRRFFLLFAPTSRQPAAAGRTEYGQRRHKPTKESHVDVAAAEKSQGWPQAPNWQCGTAISTRGKDNNGGTPGMEIGIYIDGIKLSDNVMQYQECIVILREFAQDASISRSPVVVLGADYGHFAGPVRFTRGLQNEQPRQPKPD